MRDVVVVWRASEGAAVQTFANPDKSPLVISEASAPELEGAVAATKDELTALLESHQPFEKRKVDTRVATSILGWDV